MSGFHHSHADHGEGFCTFNGLVVAVDALRAAGAVARVAVLDMDLHYGNGTASLAPTRPYLFNCSIYGNDYWQNTAFRDVDDLRHTDGANHGSIALPNGSGRAEMLGGDGARARPRSSPGAGPICSSIRPAPIRTARIPTRRSSSTTTTCASATARVFAWAQARAHADRLGAGRRLHQGRSRRSCGCISTPSTPRAETSTASDSAAR